MIAEDVLFWTINLDYFSLHLEIQRFTKTLVNLDKHSKRERNNFEG